MRRNVKKLVLASLLALAGSAVDAEAQGAPCQNRRADNIPVHIVTSGTIDQCRDYWIFFGLRITQNTTPCPSSESIHPAHQECGQTPNPGTNCVREGDVAIYTRVCSCVSQDAPMFGSLNEECDCEPFLPSGSLEDYQTVTCVVVPPPNP